MRNYLQTKWFHIYDPFHYAGRNKEQEECGGGSAEKQ